MLINDELVWTLFVESGDFDIEVVWYDVHVGKPVDMPAGFDVMQLRIAKGITRKRIDVVAIIEGRYWVIELKPLCMHYSIGQVLVYTSLFIKDYEPRLETWPVIICNKIDEDVIPECERLGVVVVANL
jgi:hypothetical protein